MVTLTCWCQGGSWWVSMSSSILKIFVLGQFLLQFLRYGNISIGLMFIWIKISLENRNFGQNVQSQKLQWYNYNVYVALLIIIFIQLLYWLCNIWCIWCFLLKVLVNVKIIWLFNFSNLYFTSLFLNSVSGLKIDPQDKDKKFGTVSIVPNFFSGFSLTHVQTAFSNSINPVPDLHHMCWPNKYWLLS